jgi:hypothetical protein
MGTNPLFFFYPEALLEAVFLVLRLVLVADWLWRFLQAAVDSSWSTTAFCLIP